MIMVLAGTKDGRILSERLCKKGLKVLATTVTEYGSRLFGHGIELKTGPLNEDSLEQIIKENNIKLIVDATHPYAKDISETAIAVSCKCNIEYLRYERESSKTEYSNMIYVKDIAEAIKVLEKYQRIFLTTGSKNLDKFAKLMSMGKYLIARVLPKSEVLKKCEDLGFAPENIIAAKGPFSMEMNCQMFKEYRADVVVTKDSGVIGGVPEKITAASKLNLPILLIERPSVNYPNVANDMDKVICEICNRFLM
ncbi:Precorrin-6x reductase [Tepidanaerobacter acetatoxydans Re1]|uniref:Precorrin-6x reductase n=1 Tax=Tepidanaerobacter acetatoxydans (strain DSM 21804 / JCM 16047 / Re1) TaxID=1209989 RepID=F4LUU0_TEPAE|nr:cobalt-precorrin-6A reductase [Tepidanaerobacter acetatoxydans]AEE90658.1 precorrin-6x reductase [Tepidanaerobacter acetatoxydans Re1]CCP25188.1 Precorrin-6x reductase [Tepidanaerobacter acetatoxydans Re1]